MKKISIIGEKVKLLCQGLKKYTGITEYKNFPFPEPKNIWYPGKKATKKDLKNMKKADREALREMARFKEKERFFKADQLRKEKAYTEMFNQGWTSKDWVFKGDKVKEYHACFYCGNKLDPKIHIIGDENKLSKVKKNQLKQFKRFLKFLYYTKYKLISGYKSKG